MLTQKSGAQVLDNDLCASCQGQNFDNIALIVLDDADKNEDDILMTTHQNSTKAFFLPAES